MNDPKHSRQVQPGGAPDAASGPRSGEAPVAPQSQPVGPSGDASDAQPAFRLRGVELGYGDRRIVGPLDLDIPAGVTTAIIGANGCGKTTLLRGLTRQLPLLGGTIEVQGRSIDGWAARSYARTVALLPQTPVIPEGMTVEQLVDRGRHPHRSWFGARSRRDDAVIASALERTNLVELADRDVSELSGGQRQRVWLALVLAQETPIVLLDEPTSYLDMSHQVELLDMVRALPDPSWGGSSAADLSGAVSPRATTVSVLHELNMAARMADFVIAMHQGQVAAAGAPADVLVPDILAEVFDLEADVIPDPLLGHPVVLARGKGQTASVRGGAAGGVR